MYRSILSEVAIGQVVGLPVYSPADLRALPLVNRGAEINSMILFRLQELGVTSVWIQDESTQVVDRCLKPETQQVIREFVVGVAQFQDELQKALRWPPARPSRLLDMARLKALIRSLGDAFREDRYHMAAIQAQPRLHDTIVDRIVTRVLLCLSLAIEMESEIFQEKIEKIRKYQRTLSLKDFHVAKDISILGIGALLLDLPDLANSEPAEQVVETGIFRQMRHEKIEHEIEKIPHATVRTMIRSRQQNFDGSGVPRVEVEENGKPIKRGLRGEEIHLLGRISRLADLLATQLMVGSSWLIALHNMQEQEQDKVDPVILNILLKLLTPFPLGSRVALNDGRLAVVIKTNSDLPCRPVIVLTGISSDPPVEMDLAFEPVTTCYIETLLETPEISCMDFYYLPQDIIAE